MYLFHIYQVLFGGASPTSNMNIIDFIVKSYTIRTFMSPGAMNCYKGASGMRLCITTLFSFRFPSPSPVPVFHTLATCIKRLHPRGILLLTTEKHPPPPVPVFYTLATCTKCLHLRRILLLTTETQLANRRLCIRYTQVNTDIFTIQPILISLNFPPAWNFHYPRFWSSVIIGLTQIKNKHTD